MCTLGVRRTPNQIDSDVTCCRSCDQGKITNKDWKVIRVEKNPIHLGFCFSNSFFGLFEKKQVFVLKKTQTPHYALFLLHHAISPFLELHNNNLLYQFWHLKLRVKNVPHFCFRKCCWSIHSKVVRLDKHTHSKQKKVTTTKLCSFTSSLCACPASSASIQSVVGFKFFERTGSLTPGLTNNRFSTTWEPLT